jgi:hypothetical protein
MLLFALLLIVAGILAASSLIIQKQPNAQDLIAKIVPFQGIIGIILLLWALINLIRILGYLGLLFQFVPVTAILFLLTLLVSIGLGFLLGYGLIAQYALNKNAGAAASGQTAMAKLAPIQIPLGLLGIGLGIWLLISYSGVGMGV